MDYLLGVIVYALVIAFVYFFFRILKYVIKKAILEALKEFYGDKKSSKVENHFDWKG